MANPDFLLKLSKVVSKEWPTLRVNHAVGAYEEKYPCANPDGPVDNSDCPEDDPLCNCPCQELKPSNYEWHWWYGVVDTETEPTDEQLEEALEATKECDNISSELGSDYLGCIWSNPDHPSSCECPCVGDKFNEYLEYTRTYATYWDTPKTTPLWRNAQMFLIQSQKALVVLNGDLSLRPGQCIRVGAFAAPNEGSKADDQKKFAGRWLVTEIEHIMGSTTHKMIVTLSRDSTPINPNESNALGFFESIVDWLF